MKKEEYFLRVRGSLLIGELPNEAAKSIRNAFLVITDKENNIASVEEFLCLVDLDYKKHWGFIAEEIARKLATQIRDGKVKLKDVKPWHSCKVNYKEAFREIAKTSPWAEVHGALNSIHDKLEVELARPTVQGLDNGQKSEETMPD